jgi:benzodiazapine receptor
MDIAARPGWLRAVVLSGGPILAAGMLGNFATLPNIAPWYDGLVKPPLNPPNWVFGPVWSLLYLLMGVAFYRILRSPDSSRRRRAIWLFAAQLAFNTAWSFAFFAARSPLLGLVVILPLEALILATIDAFRRIDGVAAACLVPYALWVAFATYLNAAIFALNG